MKPWPTTAGIALNALRQRLRLRLAPHTQSCGCGPAAALLSPLLPPPHSLPPTPCDRRTLAVPLLVKGSRFRFTSNPGPPLPPFPLSPAYAGPTPTSSSYCAAAARAAARAPAGPDSKLLVSRTSAGITVILLALTPRSRCVPRLSPTPAHVLLHTTACGGVWEPTHRKHIILIIFIIFRFVKILELRITGPKDHYYPISSWFERYVLPCPAFRVAFIHPS
jgi:hypothetical protein